jgi:hypothetical protein
MRYILIFIAALTLYSCNNEPKQTALKAAITYKSYTVSMTGNDNSTTNLRTLEKAWSLVKPGDTIRIQGRVEFDRMQTLSGRNGTATAPITITGGTVTRSSKYTQANSQELISFTGNFVHFIGITFADFTQRKGEHAYPAFRAHQANDCKFERIVYTNNAAAFSIKGKSSRNLILNSDFTGTQDPYSSSPYDGGDGLNIHDCTGTDNIVKGCRAWWNSDDGFDFWNNTGKVTIENCWSFYNGFKPGSFTPAGNGTGIKLGGGESANSNLLRIVINNLCFNNREHGIVQNNAISASIMNNTVVKHGSHGIWTGSWGGGACDLRNNISYKSGGDNARLNTRDKAGNNSWNGIAVKDGDFVSWDENQLLADRLPDGSLPGLTFLLPDSGTPITGIGAMFAAVTPPPKEPDEPPVTVAFTINVYTDNTVNKSKKPTATKELWFQIDVFTDGTIKRK